MANDRKALWKFTYGEQEYQLNRDDITVVALRGWKQQFGPQYGKFLTFTQLLLEGDADAWCCAVWLCQKNAGVKPLKPAHMMDFAVGEVMLSAGEDEVEDEFAEDEEADPPTQEADVTTPAGTET